MFQLSLSFSSTSGHKLPLRHMTETGSIEWKLSLKESDIQCTEDSDCLFNQVCFQTNPFKFDCIVPSAPATLGELCVNDNDCIPHSNIPTECFENVCNLKVRELEPFHEDYTPFEIEHSSDILLIPSSAEYCTSRNEDYVNGKCIQRKHEGETVTESEFCILGLIAVGETVFTCEKPSVQLKKHISILKERRKIENNKKCNEIRIQAEKEAQDILRAEEDEKLREETNPKENEELDVEEAEFDELILGLPEIRDSPERIKWQQDLEYRRLMARENKILMRKVQMAKRVRRNQILAFVLSVSIGLSALLVGGLIFVFKFKQRRLPPPPPPPEIEQLPRYSEAIQT